MLTPVTAAILTENSLYFIFLVIAAMALGVYLKLTSGTKKGSRADILMEKYKTMDRQTLESIPDGMLVDAVIANLMSKIDEKKGDDYLTIPLLSPGRCAVYSIWLTIKELESKGLQGFLSGKPGRFAGLAADGLELVGAERSGGAMREILNAAEDATGLPELENRLKNSISQENPLKMCVEYIRANPDEFLDE